MRNAGLEEAQAGIKTVGRNINNLRYADGTILMAESEEELIHGIFQARVLEWGAIVFSAGNTKLIKIKLLPSPSDSPEPLFGFSAL